MCLAKRLARRQATPSPQADDGAGRARYHEKEPFDLVLLDLIMPGWTVTRSSWS